MYTCNAIHLLDQPRSRMGVPSWQLCEQLYVMLVGLHKFLVELKQKSLLFSTEEPCMRTSTDSFVHWCDVVVFLSRVWNFKTSLGFKSLFALF